MKTKRIALLFLAILLMLVTFMGCTQEAEDENGKEVKATEKKAEEKKEDEPVQEEPAEIKTFRYVTVDWGTGSADQDMVIDAVNVKLLEDGMDFQLQMDGYAWDTWEQKTNLMLSTNEPFDGLLMMNGVIDLSVYIARNSILSIADEVDMYGQNLKEMIPESGWRAATDGDKLWGIPQIGITIPSINEYVTLRKDYFDAYAGRLPETTEELMEYSALVAAALKDADPEANAMGWPKVTGTPSDYLHRSYDSFPFAVYNEIFYVSQQGEVKVWIDTDEFKWDSEFWNEMLEAGLLEPDVLTLSMGKSGEIALAGLPFLFTGDVRIWDGGEFARNVPDGILACIYMEPDKPRFDSIGFLHTHMVPVTSQNPELAVRFFDWLWSSQENHDLLLWGIEGTHWETGEETIKFEDIEKSTINRMLDADGNSSYGSGGMWMFGNMKLKSYLSTDNPYSLYLDDPNAEVISGVALGFVFDASNVATEMANVQAEISASLWPIKFGVISYEDGFEDMRDRMAAAGVDTLVDEYKNQFDAWYAKQ